MARGLGTMGWLLRFEEWGFGKYKTLIVQKIARFCRDRA